MIITILNADKKYGIGKKNGLLFNLPLDMKFFRETTRGHTVCMGENTLLSFPGSKPLKDRLNIVLSLENEYYFPNVIVTHKFDEFLRLIKEHGESEDVYIIGGASIYRQTLPYFNKVLLTKVNADGGAEVFFPNLDENPDFECVDEGTPVMDGDIEIRFTTYINKNPKPIE